MGLFLLALSILPALVIFLIILGIDQEKKTKGFLFGIFGLGVASVIVALILELVLAPIGTAVENATGNFILARFVEAFFLVAIPEELCKFFAMYPLTWNNYRFNSTYDGIVYMVCSALGFATIENIGYVFGDGGSLATAIARAILSVPGHAMWGIIIGYTYGIAKYRSVKKQGKVVPMVMLGLGIAMIAHGFYDFALMSDTGIGIAFDVVFVIVSYIFVWMRASHAAKNDKLFFDYMPVFTPMQNMQQNYVYRPVIPFMQAPTYNYQQLQTYMGYKPQPAQANYTQTNVQSQMNQVYGQRQTRQQTYSQPQTQSYGQPQIQQSYGQQNNYVQPQQTYGQTRNYTQQTYGQTRNYTQQTYDQTRNYTQQTYGQTQNYTQQTYGQQNIYRQLQTQSYAQTQQNSYGQAQAYGQQNNYGQAQQNNPQYGQQGNYTNQW